MSRSLFKQLIITVFFACSLCADVPDIQPVNGARPTAAAGRNAFQPVKYPFFFRDSRMPVQPVAGSLSMPATSAYPLTLARATGGDRSIRTMDRTSLHRDVFAGSGLGAMIAPVYSCNAAFDVCAFRMPAARAESDRKARAELCSRGLTGVFPGRADMLAMIPRFKKIFEQAGVPQKWVWLAEVESSLNPNAVSSAGAAGLFQLMPGTARRFGLRTSFDDDRADPLKSAGAAAQYLACLHREFGSWPLALAAYNAGEGRVRDIMKKRKARTFDEIARYLPTETRGYVPKVIIRAALREDQLLGVPGAGRMP